MSRIVTTDLGRFNLVQTRNDPLEHAWLFECPGCGTWAYLDDDQWHGRVSVDHASMGCGGGYHETHDYAATLQARIAAGVASRDRPGASCATGADSPGARRRDTRPSLPLHRMRERGLDTR